MVEIENVIYKYKIPIIDGIFNVYMPTPIEPLHFGLQDDVPYLWAEVNKLGETEPVRFFVVGTGQELPKLGEFETKEHVGTIVGHTGVFVWHLYTIVEWDIVLKEG